VRSGEAELVDQRHLRRPVAFAAEVDGLPAQAAGDREVRGVVAAVEEGLRIRHEAGLRSDCRTGSRGLCHIASGGIASEVEERTPAAFAHSEHS
jgi:hypothetical protein